MVLTEEERKEKKRVGRRKYYQKNKDKEKANNKKYYRSAKGQAKIKENNERDEVKKRKQEWHARPEQKKKRRAYQLSSEAKILRVERNQRLKLEVYSKLSKRDSNSDIPCCNCCGESSYIEFLTVDHVNGRSHLSKIEQAKKGSHLNAWVKRNNYPDDYQILCWNCNVTKGIYGDCPHKEMA